MITDDFGNLVEPTHAKTINERLEAVVRRMAAIETDLAERQYLWDCAKAVLV